MKVFGITGGVGAGKSEVLTYLGQNYDATVIQADEAGYLVMLPGGECYGEIVKLFGRQITTETGELDRKRIAEIVFQDEEKLKALNAIVHPAVKRYIKKAAKSWQISFPRMNSAATAILKSTTAVILRKQKNS